jgi:hypothetical protein
MKQPKVVGSKILAIETALRSALALLEFVEQDPPGNISPTVFMDARQNIEYASFAVEMMAGYHAAETKQRRKGKRKKIFSKRA